MSINNLLPSVAGLSHADKFRLLHIVLEQLSKEEGLSDKPSQELAKNFNPRNYFGAAHQTLQCIDEYIVSSREGWS